MAQTETEVVQGIGSDYEIKYGFQCPTSEDYFFKSGRGPQPRDRRRDLLAQGRARLDAEVPPQVARLLPRPAAAARGAATSTEIDFENIYYYIRPTEKQANSWEDLPADIKDTWDKLGIPEAEKKYLAGVGAQYE